MFEWLICKRELTVRGANALLPLSHTLTHTHTHMRTPDQLSPQREQILLAAMVYAISHTHSLSLSLSISLSLFLCVCLSLSISFYLFLPLSLSLSLSLALALDLPPSLPPSLSLSLSLSPSLSCSLLRARTHTQDQPGQTFCPSSWCLWDLSLSHTHTPTHRTSRVRGKILVAV